MRDRAATRALVLGLLSLPFGIFAPFAIWSGARSIRRIRASNATLQGGFRAAAGLIAGILGIAAFAVGTTYWIVASS